MLNKQHCGFKEGSIGRYSYSAAFETINCEESISLLSWNLTHKDFIDKYIHCDKTSDNLIWDKRLPKIKNKISSSNVDIVCLQEIDKKSFDHDIGNFFQQKYNYSFKVNRSKKNKADFSVAMMYKSSKFECKYEDYRDRAMILLLTNKLEKAKCNKCINNKNICIYHSFFIVNVHLMGNWKINKESTRMSQIKSVLKRINFCMADKLKLNPSNEMENIRIIIVGDFNTFYGESTAQMLLSNNNSYFEHKYKFKEAYHEEIISGNHNYYKLKANDCNLRIKYYPTFAANHIINPIDLMFYTKNNFTLKGVTNTLPDKLKKEINWNEITEQRIYEWTQNDKKTEFADFSDILLLPNQQIPSDHLPIGAIFEFNNICNENNKQNKECRCCVEQQLIAKKKGKSKKKKDKRQQNQYQNTEWKFHQINSF